LYNKNRPGDRLSKTTEFSIPDTSKNPQVRDRPLARTDETTRQRPPPAQKVEADTEILPLDASTIFKLGHHLVEKVLDYNNVEFKGKDVLI